MFARDLDRDREREPCSDRVCASDEHHARAFMDNFETELERRNPGAPATLAEKGVSVFEMAKALRAHIPFIISRTYEPHASETVIATQLADIVTAMEHARAHSSAL